MPYYKQDTCGLGDVFKFPPCDSLALITVASPCWGSAWSVRTRYREPSTDDSSAMRGEYVHDRILVPVPLVDRLVEVQGPIRKRRVSGEQARCCASLHPADGDRSSDFGLSFGNGIGRRRQWAEPWPNERASGRACVWVFQPNESAREEEYTCAQTARLVPKPRELQEVII